MTRLIPSLPSTPLTSPAAPWSASGAHARWSPRSTRSGRRRTSSCSRSAAMTSTSRTSSSSASSSAPATRATAGTRSPPARKASARSASAPGRALRTLKARMRPDAHIVLAAYPYLEKNADYELRGGFLFTRYLRGRARGPQVRRHGRHRAARGGGRAERRGRRAGDLRRRGQAALRRPRAGRPRVLSQRRPVDPRVRQHHEDGVVPLQLDRARRARRPARAAAGDRAADPATSSAGGAVDIAFVVDTTGSMYSSIESVKVAAVNLVNDISARTSAARFAVVDYRDFPERTGDSGDYPAKLDLDFTSSAATVDAAIGDLSLGYGGDWAETMFSGLNRAFDLSWRPGRQEAGDRARRRASPLARAVHRPDGRLHRAALAVDRSRRGRTSWTSATSPAIPAIPAMAARRSATSVFASPVERDRGAHQRRHAPELAQPGRRRDRRQRSTRRSTGRTRGPAGRTSARSARR